MSPLTLPGTIPDLLRRCSPVVAHVSMAAGDVFFAAGARAVVFDVDPDAGLLSIEGGWFAPAQWSLDLTDPTGRAHAAWWLEDQEDSVVVAALLAVYGRPVGLDLWLSALTSPIPVSDEALGRIRLVCLHVAGLSS